jgi:hypothetical protein
LPISTPINFIKIPEVQKSKAKKVMWRANAFQNGEIRAEDQRAGGEKEVKEEEKDEKEGK